MSLIILQNFRDKTLKSDILVRENTYPMHLYKDISVLINWALQGNAFFYWFFAFFWKDPKVSYLGFCDKNQRKSCIIV